MTRREVEPQSRLRSMEQGIPESLHVPVAVRDIEAIKRFVGVPTVLAGRAESVAALLVAIHDPPPRDNRLPIWRVAESHVLFALVQVWVHVDFRPYRKAYGAAFPSLDMSGVVIDHIMNRAIARLKGLAYVRLTPISRGANSSSGRRAEQLGIAHHSTPAMMELNRSRAASVEYADLADLVKMLNIKTGRGFLDPVNEAQRLVGGQVLPPRELSE